MAQTNTPVSAEDQKKIDAFGEQWKAAQAAGDKAGMDAAHTGAENIRAQYGYSGGGDGSGRHPLEMTIPTAGAGATQAGMDSQTTQEKTGKVYEMQPNGRAPKGLQVGDQIVSENGTYSILAVNEDGTYKSKLVNPEQTTKNYSGNYSATATPTGRYYRVGKDGKTPSGLQVGDQVVTAGGTYMIDGFNDDGSYWGTLVNKAQTTQTFQRKYSTPGQPELKNPTDDIKTLLDQWFDTSREQSDKRVDYATKQGVDKLNRAMEDAAPQFQTQRNQLAANEARALDNSALYAEARGDRGGIGQAQYNEIQSAALKNRQAINAAQTKLATDTARQIADLRAQGEFEKADNLLKLTQQKLSQLMSLEQWGAQYAMSQEQMRQSLEQWQKEYDLNKANVTGYFTDGTPTRAATESAREAAAGIASALLEAGIMPNDEQLKALGMTSDQAQSYITAKQLQTAAKSSSRRGGGGGGGGGTPPSSPPTPSSAKDYTVDSKGNASVIPARSLSWNQDEGTFVWNGKTYSKVSDLVNAWNNAALSDADEEVLRRKFKSQTGVDLSKYGY